MECIHTVFGAGTVPEDKSDHGGGMDKQNRRCRRMWISHYSFPPADPFRQFLALLLSDAAKQAQRIRDRVGPSFTLKHYGSWKTSVDVWKLNDHSSTSLGNLVDALGCEHAEVRQFLTNCGDYVFGDRVSTTESLFSLLTSLSSLC